MQKRVFSAVLVIASDNSCHHAKNFNGRKILTSEFEQRVLRKCHLINCQCTFNTFADRRSGYDRRHLSNANNENSGHERRQNVGRRASDQQATALEDNLSVAMSTKQVDLV